MNFNKQIFIRPEQGLLGFRAILSTYLDLQANYTKIETEDYAFTHTEMTFVSMLSTAAVMNGWTSICEFNVDKIWSEDSRYNSNGRGDIYLTQKKIDYEIYGEAKRLWLNMSKNRRPADAWKTKIKNIIFEANEDLWRTVRDRRKEEESYCGIGIGCLTFSVTDLNQDYKQTLDEVWHCLKTSKDEYNRYLVDGLAMITVPSLNLDWAPDYPIGSILTISSFIEKDVHD